MPCASDQTRFWHAGQRKNNKKKQTHPPPANTTLVMRWIDRCVQVLGRADNLSSFVMHSQNKSREDASVTVELKMAKGENLSIMRTFSTKSNKSTWHMNGR